MRDRKELQISPLRYAPVEMTNLLDSVEKHFQERSGEQQVPPLRFASVGMTRGGRCSQEALVNGIERVADANRIKSQPLLEMTIRFGELAFVGSLAAAGG